eukprot:1104501-Alexandrium_andersonii.AAC.1
MAHRGPLDGLLCLVLAGVLQYAQPKARHDGRAWFPSDEKKKKAMYGSVGCQACLAQVRGDWAYLRQ